MAPTMHNEDNALSNVVLMYAVDGSFVVAAVAVVVVVVVVVVFESSLWSTTFIIVGASGAFGVVDFSSNEIKRSY